MRRDYCYADAERQSKFLRIREGIISGAKRVLVACVCQEGQTELNQFMKKVQDTSSARSADIGRRPQNRAHAAQRSAPAVGATTICPSGLVKMAARSLGS